MANAQTVGLLFDSGYYLDMFHNLKMMTAIRMCVCVCLCCTERDFDCPLLCTQLLKRHYSHLLYIPSASSVLVEPCSVILLCQTMQLQTVSRLPWTTDHCVVTDNHNLHHQLWSRVFVTLPWPLFNLLSVCLSLSVIHFLPNSIYFKSLVTLYIAVHTISSSYQRWSKEQSIK